MAEEIRDPYSGNVINQPVTPTITPASVYTTSNVQQATTAPVVAPDDLLGIRRQLMNELGVTTAQEQANQIASQLAAQRQTSRAQQLAIQNLPQALNVIRGEQAQAQQISSAQEQALAENLSTAQSAVAAKRMEAEAQFAIRQQEVQEKKNLILQYPGAKITFGDSMETVTSKLVSYQKQVEKDTYKKELKRMALSLGLSTSGSTSKLEKRIKKANKSALSLAKQESELKLEALRADIAKAKSGGKTASDLEMEKLKMEALKQDISSSQIAQKSAEQEYQYKQQQIDEMNKPDTGLSSWWNNSSWSPKNWF